MKKELKSEVGLTQKNSHLHYLLFLLHYLTLLID